MPIEVETHEEANEEEEEDSGRLPYRVSYDMLTQFLGRFRVSKVLHKRELEDLTWLSDRKRVWSILGFLEIPAKDVYRLTAKGEQFLNSSSDTQTALFMEALLDYEPFRYLWARICDMRENFTVEGIAPVLKDHTHTTDKQAVIHAQKVTNWAKSVGLAGSKYKGNYRILHRVTLGKSPRERDRLENHHVESPRQRISSMHRLNLLISDFLAEEEPKAEENDLIQIKALLDEIRKEDLWDDTIIDMLEREIRHALKVEAHSAFQLVGKTLKDIRKRYLEEAESG